MGLFAGSTGNGGGEKRGRGRPKKDPFADLSEDFQAEVLIMTVDEIRAKMGDVAKVIAQTVETRKADIDLADKKEAVKDAGAVYKEVIDASNLKIRFMMQLLSDKGIE